MCSIQLSDYRFIQALRIVTITIYLFVKAQQALYRFRPRLAKGIVLIQAVCQEKQDPSDTFEGLTHTYLPKKLMKSDHDLEKIR